MKIYSVYILANKKRGTLYIGFTNDLKRRILEHKQDLVDGFSKKYDLKKLVYVDNFQYVTNAIGREKQFKRWHRQWKINLIEQQNPKWLDLYEKFFGKDMDPETSFHLRQGFDGQARMTKLDKSFNYVSRVCHAKLVSVSE